jgi:starch phosphorylase
VWLNNPVYPLEASGTSGMKAGINGVINLSILDGWWGEGYDGANGWAIKPDTQSLDPFRRDREDARTLYEMLREYVLKSYVPGAHQGRVYREQGGAAATEVAAWKARVREAWPGVSITRLDPPARRLRFGEAMTIEVALALNGLAPTDVAVELLLRRGRAPQSVREERHSFAADALLDDGRQRYVLRLRPDLCGSLDYTIRAYPSHARLSHPLEMGLMRWI